VSNPLTKKCTRCGEEKDLNLFSPSKTGKMGRYPRCRSCENTASRKIYRIEENIPTKTSQKNGQR